MATKQYTSDNIKVLNDIEHIQLRSGMYIGEANDPRSLFSEMFDNAMDEVSAGHSTELIVIPMSDKVQLAKLMHSRVL